jgi:LuxR family transcriptional regulator, maltose regulon positive regulatory protein
MVDFPNKIIIPQYQPHLLSRPQLTEPLAAITHLSLIVLTAPAGYGKTSLLIDFANHYTAAPICWYALDTFDQDPWTFLAYLISAIEKRCLGATRETTLHMENRNGPTFTTVLTLLAREIGAIPHDIILIFDDWHLVDSIVEINETIGFILLRCPNCHLILASRSYPSIPNIARLAARRQLISLQESHIRFSPPEVMEILNKETPNEISLAEAKRLVEQTDGWITGVLLAHRTTNLNEVPTCPRDARNERQVYHFLAEQVIAQHSSEITAFLCESALLEDLTPENCNTILDHNDSRRMFERIVRHHLFITEIKPDVYRYHPVFRDFLREHLKTTDPQRFEALVRRLAISYEAEGQWSLAFDNYHALGDATAARRIVATGGVDLYTHGRLETIERWLTMLPANLLDTPSLCLLARVLIDRNRVSEARQALTRARTRACPEELPDLLLLQAQLERLAGRYASALELAQQALAQTTNQIERAQALRTIAICHHRLGKNATAIDELHEALALEEQRGDLHAIAKLLIDLGICHRELGLLDIAEDYYVRAEHYWASIGNSGLHALCLNSKGGVQSLAGRYCEALHTLQEAQHYAQQAAVPNYSAAIFSTLGELYSDLRFWDDAASAYEQATRQSTTAHLTSTIELGRVRLAIRQRSIDVAAQRLRQLSKHTLQHYRTQVLLLQACVACATKDYSAATSNIEQAIDDLESGSSSIDLARAYLVRAEILLAATPADRTAFIAALDRAAAIADRLGHESFLAADLLHAPYILRRALAAGWQRAAVWLNIQHDMHLVRQTIHQQDGRPHLGVRALGIDQLTLDGQPVQIGWLKARELLYYLLVYPHGASSAVLCEAIWPDLSPERASETLRTAIYQLRLRLPRNLIIIHRRHAYQLNRADFHIEYDVERFLSLLDAHADDPEALAEVLDLYHDHFLVSMDSQWIIGQRVYLEQRYLKTLRIIAHHWEISGIADDALLLYGRILQINPLNETAHAGIMRCQLALGSRASAIAQYHEARRRFDEELGLELGHDSEIEQLYRRILDES